jgi:membrane protease YdiL (CAAX protease family)
MRPPRVNPLALWGTVALAAILWFVTFFLAWSNFWIKISCSAALLALLAFKLQPDYGGQMRFGRKALVQGFLSAAALYGIFWLGKVASTALFPFAAHQIGAIYGKGAHVPLPVVFALLLLVTGPCEEIYWRGFLQRQLMLRFGNWRGWALGSAIYAGVHIWSFNFMLIGAAAVAGAFWGLLYWRWQRLAPVIVSHAVWSAVIFAVAPIP